ncbi:MAG: UDP-N-acetylmuramoyl-tripeptide--D-alanyl-D-alanine ligase [Candidatus Marinimicrobia bacterium]|nr:UDP-N-acetylmuramoyl-tripeptide--D-alanyl-D-alanine ligase [Candidatus Neomarinimicrobiota bacterium]
MKIKKIFDQQNVEFNNINFENFYSVSINSREIKKGNIFCALHGENTNGHNYIKSAIENGALAAIAEKKEINENTDLKNYPLIIVDDSLEALQKAATNYGKIIKAKIFTITGSAGKTTTRNLISKVLGSSFSVTHSIKNYNNHIGLPLSILQINEKDDFAIIEMGANHVGEIAALCKIIKPNYGLITSISEAHIEGFGSIENVQKAKFELFDSVDNNGIIFINNDDLRIREYKNNNLKKITYSIKSNADYELKIIDYDQFGRYTLEYMGKNIKLNSIGYGAAQNAAAALTVGKTLGLSTDTIIEQIENYDTPQSRGNILKLNDYFIINDTYNANPLSINLAIRSLNEMDSKGKIIMVLGDMLEMGNLSESSHKNIGTQIARSKIDYLFCYGDETINTIDSARKYDMMNAIHFDDKKSLVKTLISLAKPNDIIYIKGSRGLKMETIIEELKKSRTK